MWDIILVVIKRKFFYIYICGLYTSIHGRDQILPVVKTNGCHIGILSNRTNRHSRVIMSYRFPR